MIDDHLTALAVLLALIGLVLLAWANPARGLELAPHQALAIAQERGLAPAWIDWRDTFRLARSGRQVALCVEDRQGGGRFVFHGDLARLLEWRDTGRVDTDPDTWVTASLAVMRLCWPDWGTS